MDMVYRWSFVKWLIILCSIWFNLDQVMAQDSTTVIANNKGIIYRKEATIDARLHTNGLALALNFGKIKTYYRTQYTHLEIGYMTDAREQSYDKNIYNPSIDFVPKSYKYGKQNYMFVVRAGKGQKKFLSDKAIRKGVTIGTTYEVGPAIAILKPYYLDLFYQTNTGGSQLIEIRTEKYTAENKDKFLDFNSIAGRSSFSKGLGELSVIPGIQGKYGIFFSVGSFDKWIKSLELGVMADVYIKKIPIMVETANVSNKPYFINFYLNIQLGKRTN